MKPPPPIPQVYGAVTPIMAEAATAPSTALPPACITWIAADVACASSVAAARPRPVAVGCAAGALDTGPPASASSRKPAMARRTNHTRWRFLQLEGTAGLGSCSRKPREHVEHRHQQV